MYKVRIASRHPSHRVIRKLGQMPEFPVRVRVRFGSQKKHRRCDIDFNSIEAIENTANKVKMKCLFSTNGVNSPRYLSNNDNAAASIMDGYLGDKIFFKTPYHSRGRGMRVYDDKGLAVSETRAGYFEQSQISKREFRVHVMDGEAFCIDEKVPRIKGSTDNPVVKNMENGYKFREPKTEYPDEVISESIKAVEALGLVFGAADVGLNDEGVWIYEVNTAPSLRTRTRKLYQKSLVKYIWKQILGDKKYRVWVGDVCSSRDTVTMEEAESIRSQHDLGMGDVRIIDEVERKSAKYNRWLDEQPLTPATSELNQSPS